MQLFLEIITTGSCEDPGVFVLLCNSWCPPSPPSRNNKRLQGCSPYFGAEGMDKQSSLKLHSENTGDQRKRWDHFSFISVAGMGRGESIPFIMAQCSHPQPCWGILWDWSRGEETDTSVQTSLNSRWQKLALLSEDPSSLFSEVTF